VRPEDRDESLKRLNAVDDIAGEGIRVLGHWHNVNLLEGWAVVEADSEAAFAKWMMGWTDLNVNEATPVIDLDELRALTS